MTVAIVEGANSPAASTENAEAQLKAVGLRVTAPRLATLNIVAQNQHADADRIAQLVRENLGSVSTQAVYDVLHALTDAGLIRRISVHGRKALYETHRHDNHHHLVCRQCGRLEDVECAKGEAPCLHVPAAASHGFEIDEADVIYRGYCPNCQAANTQSN